MSDIEHLSKLAAETESKITECIKALEHKRNELAEERFKDALSKDQTNQIDLDALPAFLEEPYVMIPKQGNEWVVLVPKWLKFQVGYLDYST